MKRCFISPVMSISEIFSDFQLFNECSDLIFLHSCSILHYCFSHANVLFYVEMHMLIHGHDMFVHNGIFIKSLLCFML